MAFELNVYNFHCTGAPDYYYGDMLYETTPYKSLDDLIEDNYSVSSTQSVSFWVRIYKDELLDDDKLYVTLTNDTGDNLGYGNNDASEVLIQIKNINYSAKNYTLNVTYNAPTTPPTSPPTTTEIYNPYLANKKINKIYIGNKPLKSGYIGNKIFYGEVVTVDNSRKIKIYANKYNTIYNSNLALKFYLINSWHNFTLSNSNGEQYFEIPFVSDNLPFNLDIKIDTVEYSSSNGYISWYVKCGNFPGENVFAYKSGQNTCSIYYFNNFYNTVDGDIIVKIIF